MGNRCSAAVTAANAADIVQNSTKHKTDENIE